MLIIDGGHIRPKGSFSPFTADDTEAPAGGTTVVSTVMIRSDYTQETYSKQQFTYLLHNIDDHATRDPYNRFIFIGM